MTIDQLTTFFGWLSVLSIGYMILATGAVLLMNSWMTRIHSTMFDMDPADLKRSYFTWLANCKLIVVFLILGPYVALRVM